jgi:hypothetical protein
LNIFRRSVKVLGFCIELFSIRVLWFGDNWFFGEDSVRANLKYAALVTLLAVLAVVFGLAGTLAPSVSDSGSPAEAPSTSSSSSVTHFVNPPTFDSGWVDIRDKTGQHFNITHNLNTTEVFVDITGRQTFNIPGGALTVNETYGGAGTDIAVSVVETSDGGYAIAGYTNSFGAGGVDFWLVKTDSAGNMLWNKTYGRTNNDFGYSVIQTSDGGYAIAGYTSSFGAGGADFWLIKTDVNGIVQWNQTYGGTGSDVARCVIQTSDGGYALGGYTNSFGAGIYDFWLVKTEADGSMQWNQTYGGANYDQAYSLVQTLDNGYALAGYTNSYGAGGADFWLVKADLAGNHLWNRTYGASDNDYAYSLVQTNDGGYALAGATYSYGLGSDDFWLVKTDSSGYKIWSRTYGGTGSDRASSLIQTSDGGFAMVGRTSISDPYFDFWLVTIDKDKIPQLRFTYGGASGDYAFSVVQTSDGGYAIAGSTKSYGAGSDDFWLVKVEKNVDIGLEHQRNLGATGVTSGWTQTYGGTSDDQAYSVVRTSDGGYAITGYTSIGASTDFWLVKINSLGNMEWSRTYGGTGWDKAYSLVQTDDALMELAVISGLSRRMRLVTIYGTEHTGKQIAMLLHA